MKKEKSTPVTRRGELSLYFCLGTGGTSELQDERRDQDDFTFFGLTRTIFI